ncbi:transcriptional regulator%2C MerR family [Staphylococcus aureus]|nr:transcriptional regulator%2C MerR family [Staphylococcus aureus]
MKTKEVVALMNISQDTLRYYEKVGVIPPVNRDENGYRIYVNSGLKMLFYGGLKMSFFSGLRLSYI